MKKYRVTLRKEERGLLEVMVQKGNHKARKVLNALVLLNCDEGRFQDHRVKNEDMASVNTSVATFIPSKELILPGKIETLLHPKERADTITRILVRLCKSVYEEDLVILTSMRGIAAKISRPFLAELDDWRNFASYKKVLALPDLIQLSTNRESTTA